MSGHLEMRTLPRCNGFLHWKQPGKHWLDLRDFADRIAMKFLARYQAESTKLESC